MGGASKKKAKKDPTKGKPKGNKFVKPKKEIMKKEVVSNKGTCFHFGKDDYWKSNCNFYLAKLKQKKASETSSSGIFVIEVNVLLTNSTSLVLDIGYGSPICNALQVLRRSRKLDKGEYDVQVTNAAIVARLAVGTFCLDLPFWQNYQVK